MHEFGFKFKALGVSILGVPSAQGYSRIGASDVLLSKREHHKSQPGSTSACVTCYCVVIPV